jgi:hypothetical protein
MYDPTDFIIWANITEPTTEIHRFRGSNYLIGPYRWKLERYSYVVYPSYVFYPDVRYVAELGKS